MVFAIGVDAIYYDKQTLSGRNKLFTAFTRTKAWLRVSGMGEYAEYFFREIKTSMDNSPELVFTVPDPKKIRSMKRDLSNTTKEIYALREAYDDLIKKGMTREQIELELEVVGRDVKK
jgi:superfamily I DNA and RNA helicase